MESDPAPKKNASINVRVRPELKRRVQAIYERYRVTESDLVGDAVTAACDYVEANDGYRGPVMMLSRESRENRLYQVAESDEPLFAMTDDAARREPADVAEAFVANLADEIKRHPFARDPIGGRDFLRLVRQQCSQKMTELLDAAPVAKKKGAREAEGPSRTGSALSRSRPSAGGSAAAGA